MATSEYSVNHAMARQEWSKKLMKEALEETYCFRFMGESANSPIQIKNELKESGYKVTFGLRMQLSGAGRSGDATLEGHEEALTVYTDSVVIDQLRHAVRTHGRASEQRVPFSTREEAKDGLKDWWSRRMDQSWLNQVCGISAGAAGGLAYTGLNEVSAVDSDHIVFNGETTEAALSDSAGNTFSLTFFDEAIEKARTLDPIIKPVRVGGQNKYIAMLHPYQVKDLRTQYSSTEITWYDTQRALVEGGKGINSPIYNGALGEYNGIVIHESENVPISPTNTQAYRAVLLGAQSSVCAFGKNYSKNSMDWVEELYDYQNQLGVAAGMVFGLKKTRFNNKDYASIVMASGAG